MQFVFYQQHAGSLVKHTTLSLLVVILKRAQNTASYLALTSAAASSSSSSPHHTYAASQSAEAPLPQQFREEVIKALPDVTTIISLRQNLVSGRAKAESQEEGTSLWSDKNQPLPECNKYILQN